MAKSLVQLEKQIDALRRQADGLKRKEVKGVVARIRQAIEYYQLTPADLGFAGGAKRGPKAAASPGRTRAGRKTVGRIKFRDEAGNTWTGHGRRPKWYVEAIAAGKTPEQLTA
jgi:DNA-binding protein H-NS